MKPAQIHPEAKIELLDAELYCDQARHGYGGLLQFEFDELAKDIR